MDVQKYIKRLKFARADWSRNIGKFESREDALNFLNGREFFFGDPFVVKYTENGETKLMLAIGKSENPEITADTTEITGGIGPDAYELIDISDIKDQIEKLWESLNEEISARTEGDAYLQEQVDEVKDAIDNINSMIEELSGATDDIKEIVGEGWTDSPDNVTITDRIKKDEELAGIVWGHNDGEPYNGHLTKSNLPYASGESLAEMIETISNTLTGVLFEDGDKTKAIKFEYNPGRNILYYTAGTETGEIKLSQAAIVDRGYYDAESEELVIDFILGEGEKQEVRIPVGSLITEWEVVDTDTVHLNRERVTTGGPDKLSADVKVSDDADNMLVAKSDGLHVSNSGLTKAENELSVIKGDLAVLEDGHFPADYFSGATVNGSTNIQEALLKLDGKLIEDEAKHDEDIAAVRNEISELSDKVDSGFTSVNDAIESLDEKVDSGFTKNKVEFELDGDASHLVLEGSFAEDGHIIYTLGEQNIASEDAVAAEFAGTNIRLDEIQTQLNEEKGYREAIKLVEISHDKFEDLGLSDNVRDAYFVTYHKPNSTEPYEEPQPGDAIVKVYKDSVIYKIYFGHVDDAIAGPNDPTVIPGTGATAICFIYFNANGEYALSTNEFVITDELWAALDGEKQARENADNELQTALDGEKQARENADGELDAKIEELVNNEKQAREDADNELDAKIEELANAIQEEIDVTAIVLNRLAESVVAAKTEIELERGTNHIYLEKRSGSNGQDVYVIGEDGIADIDDVVDGFSEINGRCDDLQNAINEESSNRVLDMNSLSLAYDSAAQDLVLNWQASGSQHSTRVDVSDFVKDSFLESVQIVTRDGVQYIEFRFKTYDGKPIPLYVPLTDLATIYKAGQAIDKQELENNQVITVKIDEFARKNYLAKSDNGLLVTGVTEEIQEAVSEITEELEDYVRKDEVKDHLDSASTLPVQSKVIFDALQNIDLDGYVKKEDVEDFLDSASTNPVQNKVIAEALQNIGLDGYVKVEDVEDHLDSASTNPVQNRAITNALNDLNDRKADKTELDEESQSRQDGDDELWDAINALSAFTADTISANNAYFENLTANTIVNNEFHGNEADFRNITSVTITTNEISGNEAYFSGITANTIYADEYDNLPTATTEQFGVVILDDVLDSASTNPVENQAITKVILDNEETVAAALSDLNNRKADKDYVDENFATKDDTADLFAGVQYCGSTHEIVFTNRNGNEVGSVNTGDFIVDVTIDSQLDSASTNPVENRAITKVILDNEEAVAAALNGLNDRKADATALNDLSNIVNNCVTGVTPSGTGNVVTSLTKNGKEIVVGMGEVDLSSTITGVTSVTASTATQFVSEIVKDGQNVKATLVDIDDELSTSSTRPVQNQAITNIIIENERISSAAFNDLNRRKANIEDIPVSLSELEGYSDMATKDYLGGFLPLSGGTMTGNISGNTGCAVYMPGGFFQDSDERLKIFMGDIDNALEKAKQIPTTYFYWKDRYDGPREIGTSAQKVQEFFPEIVSGGDKLSVDYSKLAVVALAAIKELSAKVDDLQRQLDELKK